MNLTVVLIVIAALALVLLVIIPRVKGMSWAQRMTSERRSGSDRRRRRIRVPFERRKQHRRSDDAAEDFVSRLESDR